MKNKGKLILTEIFPSVQNMTFKSILAANPTGKRPLGRPRRRWEDNIRMDLKATCINARNKVDSAQDRDYWRKAKT